MSRLDRYERIVAYSMLAVGLVMISEVSVMFVLALSAGWYGYWWEWFGTLTAWCWAGYVTVRYLHKDGNANS